MKRPAGTIRAMPYPALALRLHDRWVADTGGPTRPVIDPASGERLGDLPMAGPRELREAVASAQQGFATWSAMSAFERFRILSRGTALLRERAAAIAQVLTLEQGKPAAEALREVTLAAEIVDFLAEEAKRLPSRGMPARAANVLSQTVMRVPVGPVAAFTPWNFPANLPARKLGGALAAGCSVIIKPSEETPATCIEIVRALLDAGLPDGVVNLVAGDPAAIADTLITDPAVAKLSFTGSVAVGRQLGEKAARHLKRYTAELGGHAPVIVCADADAASAAALCVAAKYRNAGQVCASPIRFLVHRSRYAAFRDAFVAGAQALRIGAGHEPGVQVGPLVAERRLHEMQAFVDDALAAGAALLCGGRRLPRAGFFYAPTVLEHAPAHCRVQREEPFGPIALLDAFDELDDAIARANALPYGLAAYGFTRDLAVAYRLSHALRAGMVGINHFGVSQPETPFGGVGASGSGHESGLEGLLAYTDLKFVSLAS
jgi:succinate-semialdehyde dehydrogenase/glutarate-semialdehyde dehydrogenase